MLNFEKNDQSLEKYHPETLLNRFVPAGIAVLSLL